MDPEQGSVTDVHKQFACGWRALLDVLTSFIVRMVLLMSASKQQIAHSKCAQRTVCQLYLNKDVKRNHSAHPRTIE